MKLLNQTIVGNIVYKSLVARSPVIVLVALVDFILRANTCDDFDTRCIVEQRRLRKACANAQTCHSPRLGGSTAGLNEVFHSCVCVRLY